MTGNEQKHFHALDGLRAFAIILVMLFHAEDILPPASFYDGVFSPYNIAMNGFLGVDLFFVLSGFLIASQLLRKTITIHNAKIFAVRRFFRIAPAYFFILSFCVLSMKIIKDENGSYMASLFEWGPPFIAHLFFIHDYIFSEYKILGVFWTLPIEMKFYLLCPGLIFAISRLKNIRTQISGLCFLYITYLCIKIFTVLMMDTDNMWLDKFNINVRNKFHFSLDGLMIGVLCAYLHHYKIYSSFLKNPRISNAIFASACAVVLIIMIVSPYYETTRALTLFELIGLTPLLSLLFGIMVLSSLNANLISSLLSHSFLGFIAKISYALYLVHLLTLFTIAQLLINFGWNHQHITLFGYIAFVMLYGTLSCLFAYFLHIHIEKPIWDWSKKKFKDPQ